MRGLLRKDFYLLFKTYKFMLIIVAAYFAVALASLDASPNYMLYFATGSLIGIVPTGIYMGDEGSRWTEYSLTLPYSRAALASSKYVMTLINGAVFAAAFASIELLRRSGAGSAALVFSLVFTAAIMQTALSMPFLYAFGAAIARVVYIAVYLLIFGVGMSFFAGANSLENFSFGALGSPVTASLLVLAAAFAVFMLSWAIGIICYKRRSF